MTAILWIVAALLVLIGLAGTLLPVLPGALLVFAGLVLAAWSDGFSRVGPWAVLALGALTVLFYVIDLSAGAWGTRGLGASRRAFWGALAGTLVGLFFGLIGVIVGPFLGALAGEYWARKDIRRAGRVGGAAWLGMVLGTAARLALVFAMLGIFAAAWLW